MTNTQIPTCPPGHYWGGEAVGCLPYPPSWPKPAPPIANGHPLLKQLPPKRAKLSPRG